MAVRITTCGFSWHIFDNVGFIRLQGQDGTTWTSGAIDPETFVACAALLKKVTQAQDGLSLSDTQLGDLKNVLTTGNTSGGAQGALPW